MSITGNIGSKYDSSMSGTDGVYMQFLFQKKVEAFASLT